MAYDALEFLCGLFREPDPTEREAPRPGDQADPWPPAPLTPPDLPPDWHLLWDERAAIMEWDGGLPRERAEAAALRDTLSLMTLLEHPAIRGWTDREQFLFLQLQWGLAVAANTDAHPNLISWARQHGLYIDISAGPWACPFTIGKDGDRRTVYQKYEEHFQTRQDLQSRIGELRGKVLVCHCSPRRCHGDFLARAANNHACTKSK